MKNKCKDCKHYRNFWVANEKTFYYGDDSCDLKRNELKKDKFCLRFIKKNGKIHKLQNHLQKHWKTWIFAIIPFILFFLNRILN